MILVDSSVLVDLLRDTETAETRRLDQLKVVDRLAVPDLVVAEVLQGLPHERQFRQALVALDAFERIRIGGFDVAVAAARHCRQLRSLGITVHGTIDCLIATRCIVDGHALLTSDRDFQPFARHLGLMLA
jgi:hypothetical protein